MTAGTDLHLDAVLADFRHRIQRRKRGRVVCTVEILEGVCIGHRIEEDGMLERDVERLMCERPRSRVLGGKQGGAL